MNAAARLDPGTKADIQGFVTSAFGHLPHGALLFLEFLEPASSRSWLEAVLPEVTTAASWRARPDAPKLKPSQTFNVAFTAAGLRALALSEKASKTFPIEFQRGMADPERSRILGDNGGNAPKNWELGGPSGPVLHAMVILHAESVEKSEAAAGEQREKIDSTAGAVREHRSLAQHGERPSHGREPFGFFDGMGQPKIKGIHGEGVNTGEFILGHLNEYQFHPPGPAAPGEDDPGDLLPALANPHHRAQDWRDPGRNGTFVVYRKLRQDVAQFWRFLEAESVRMRGSADPGYMVWLASKLVGRWPGGAPLALSPDRDRPEYSHRDDFLYAASDPNGLACPFGSHIRRANPRDQIRPAGPEESLRMSARHRLLRRGLPFGPALFDPTVLDHLDAGDAGRAILELRDDGRERGLHFLCVNASLKGQFEFVQQAWVNNPRFNGVMNNPDPLIGIPGEAAEAPGSMHIPGCPVGVRTSPLPRFVTVRGGGYFFMPGLTALRFLAAPLPSKSR